MNPKNLSNGESLHASKISVPNRNPDKKNEKIFQRKPARRITRVTSAQHYVNTPILLERDPENLSTNIMKFLKGVPTDSTSIDLYMSSAVEREKINSFLASTEARARTSGFRLEKAKSQIPKHSEISTESKLQLLKRITYNSPKK